jgi:hypothetical protein
MFEVNDFGAVLDALNHIATAALEKVRLAPCWRALECGDGADHGGG